MEGGVISEVGIGQLFGLFNIVAGLLLVAALLTFGGGLVSYFGRLALAKRDESLITMQWGVRLMFVLVLMLGIVEFIQLHTALVLQLLAVAVLIGLIYTIMLVVKSSGESEDKH